ncbi:MAG: hypothetical protein RLZZ188_1168 [Verrucomicrobiota bacterium]
MTPEDTTTPPADELRRAEAGISLPTDRLFTGGVVITLGLLIYYGATSKLGEPLHLYLGLAMLALAVVPALVWARKGAKGLPAFEVFVLMTANAYALPLLSGHLAVRAYDMEVITESALTLIAFQLSAISAFLVTRGWPGKSSFFTSEVLTKDLQKFVLQGMVVSTAYAFISTFYPSLIPYEYNSVIRAVAFGVGMVTIFSESRRWGLGGMSLSEKGFFSVMLAVQVVSNFATLFLVTGMSVVVLALVGYVTGARKLPFAATAVVFAVAALLHNGKSTMRGKYWNNEEVSSRREVQDLPGFLSEWIEAGLTPSREQEEKAMAKKLLERSSVFHILCLVVANSPHPLPYLGGETYRHVPGQLIPRFFWPEKPQAHIATDILCIYYGLQDEVTVRNATIGFGMICEAYANFGLTGVIVFGVLLGFLFRKAQRATENSPLLSYAGMFMIVLTAWSFQTEANLAIWLSSMFQGLIAVLGIPFLIRNITQ